MRIISLKVVKEMTSLGTTSIYKFMNEGSFPRSVRLGATRVGWLLSDVEAWIQARIAESAAAATSKPGRQ
jgi:prophage regulatory protein